MKYSNSLTAGHPGFEPIFQTKIVSTPEATHLVVANWLKITSNKTMIQCNPSPPPAVMTLPVVCMHTLLQLAGCTVPTGVVIEGCGQAASRIPHTVRVLQHVSRPERESYTQEHVAHNLNTLDLVRALANTSEAPHQAGSTSNQ